MTRSLPAALPAAAAVAVFLLLFVVPVVGFYALALEGEGVTVLIAEAERAIVSGRLGRIAGFTVGQAALSALISVAVALPGAYLLATFAFPGRRAVYSFTLLPFVLPSIIVVIAMISFFGRGGLLNQLFGTQLGYVYSFAGIIAAHVFYNFSLALRILTSGFQSIDRRYIEAAASLGDGRLGRMRRVVAPLLTPTIITSFLLVFVFCFLSFGVVLVFGGVQYETFEVRIYSDIHIRLNFVSAALYAAVQLLMTGLLFLFGGRVIARRTSARAEIEEPTRRLAAAPALVRGAAVAYGGTVGLFLLGPLGSMLYRSLTAGGRLDLTAYAALFGGETTRNVESILRASLPQVIGQSILLAFLSGTLTFLLAVALAWSLRRGAQRPGAGPWSTAGRSAVETLVQLPLGVSLVTVALGVRMLYAGRLPLPAMVVGTQVVATMPLVFRIVSTEMNRLRESYVEGARSLGAGTPRIVREIALPVLRRGLLNAYAYSLAFPFADLTAVLTVGRGEIATFPVAIYRLIGFRSFDLALALSGLYLLICFLLFLWIDRTSLSRNPAAAGSLPTATGAAATTAGESLRTAGDDRAATGAAAAGSVRAAAHDEPTGRDEAAGNAGGARRDKAAGCSTLAHEPTQRTRRRLW